MGRIRKWLYLWGWLRSYQSVYIPRYLQNAGDPRYVSHKDRQQDGGGEVLVRASGRRSSGSTAIPAYPWS